VHLAPDAQDIQREVLLKRGTVGCAVLMAPEMACITHMTFLLF